MIPDFDPPIARRTDPRSSHVAAREITADGSRKQQRNLTVAAVSAFPGRTSQELAELTHHDRYMLARRLPEAAKENRVHRGPIKRCSITNKLALTWFPGAAEACQLELLPSVAA